MANSVITYPAQKLKIKSLRGSHFKLVINVKNDDGSNYDFTGTQTDVPRIKIFQSNGEPLFNSPSYTEVTTIPDEGAYDIIHDIINTTTEATLEDGKITFEYPSGKIFAPWPGRYKYNIYTASIDNQTYHMWLYGDFIVTNENSNIDFVSIESIF